MKSNSGKKRPYEEDNQETGLPGPDSGARPGVGEGWIAWPHIGPSTHRRGCAGSEVGELGGTPRSSQKCLDENMQQNQA